MTNLDSVLQYRDITLLAKVHIVKATIFLVVMYRCERWTIKKAEHRRIDAFQLWFWRRLLRVPWTTRRSNQSILKEINPEYSLEGLMLKFQYFGHLLQRLIGKDPDAGKDWGQEEKGVTEDETVGWHHWFNGHEFKQIPGDSEGFPGGLDSKAPACNAGDPGSNPGSAKSPGEGNGNPLQYSCLENSMDWGAW